MSGRGTGLSWMSQDRIRLAWDYVLAGVEQGAGAAHQGLLRSFDARAGRWVKPYPEVTGYTIRGLLDGARALGEPRYETAALEMGRALLRVQQREGPAAGAVPAADLRTEYYVFDTAQVIEGLVSLHHHTSDASFLQGAIRAGEFCLGLQDPNGSFRPAVIGGRPYEPTGREDWGLRRSYIQMRGASGWHALSRATGDPRFERMAAACREWVAGEIRERYADGFLPPCRPVERRRGLRSFLPPWRRALPETATYSHPGAYAVRGLVEDFLATGNPLGVHLALRIVRASVLPHVSATGYLPYGVSLDGPHRPVTSFSYVSGEAQYAWVLCRLWQITRDDALLETAARLLAYCAEVQDRAPRAARGGLYQYADPSAAPSGRIHLQLHVWGTKFFAEALALYAEVERYRSSPPGGALPVVAVPWTVTAAEEAIAASSGPSHRGLRFRMPWGAGPVTLCTGRTDAQVSVRDASGAETPAPPVPGLPGVFRLKAAAGTVYSVSISAGESGCARPPG